MIGVRVALLGVAATFAVIPVAGCTPDRGDPFIDFDTRTNVVTIDAPIKQKRKYKPDRNTTMDTRTRYVFDFKVEEHHDGEDFIYTHTARVTKDVYDAYGEGDSLRLRCLPTADFCEVQE